MRKTIAVLLIVLMGCSSAAFAAAPTDTVGTAYEKAVSELYARGIISGYEDGSFRPDSELTRAEAAVMIVTAAKPADYSDGKSGFMDMSGYGWAEPFVGYALDNGIVHGTDSTHFAPGLKVTGNELVTMMVGALGYDALDGKWPANYIKKADELGITKGLTADMSKNATRGLTAQVIYNSLSLMDRPAPKTPAAVPDTTGLTFETGRVNEYMTTFNTNALAKDVVVYVYGQSKDYKADMTFSKNGSDYRIGDIHNLKKTRTPAFFKAVDGKITQLIVPSDVGYTGNVYGVINGIEKATLKTLTAGNAISWTAKEASVISADIEKNYLTGEVYHMAMTGGAIQSVTTAASDAKDSFRELTSGFTAVSSSKSGSVTLAAPADSAEQTFGIKNTATIYVAQKDATGKITGYVAGNKNSIEKGKQVRLYNFTDVAENSADIVVVQ